VGKDKEPNWKRISIIIFYHCFVISRIITIVYEIGHFLVARKIPRKYLCNRNFLEKYDAENLQYFAGAKHRRK